MSLNDISVSDFVGDGTWVCLMEDKGQLHLDQEKGIGASQLVYHQCKVDNWATPSLTIN